MFGSQKLLYVVLAVAVLGCADQPTSPRTATDTPARSSAHPAGVIRTFDDELEEISLEIPGFAGFYLQDGELIIRGVGSVDSAAIVDAVRAAAISKGLLPPEFSAQPAAFRSARYDFRTLVEWKRLLRDQVSDREVLLVDLDELQNVLRVGVASSAAEERVRESLRSIGVPLDGMLVYPTQPAVPEALLTDKFRPIPAGVTK